MLCSIKFITISWSFKCLWLSASYTPPQKTLNCIRRKTLWQIHYNNLACNNHHDCLYKCAAYILPTSVQLNPVVSSRTIGSQFLCLQTPVERVASSFATQPATPDGLHLCQSSKTEGWKHANKHIITILYTSFPAVLLL